MFVAESKLPHVLPPGSYGDPSIFTREQATLQESWHVVAAIDELKQPGDFVTRFVCGRPLQIRNFNGKLRALSNVCAHRHALISSKEHGHSSTMRCQYHGWEYQSNGCTGKIPEPKNFVPFENKKTCLPVYAVDTVGQLVFVNVSDSPIPLPQFLGEEYHALLSTRFGCDWRLSLTWNPTYDVNWKIPIENSLEAYHVPAVHPHTFRDDPGNDRSHHTIEERHTSFETSLPFSPHSRLDSAFQHMESQFVKWLGLSPTGRYSQHHVFPNLLFSFTDALSLCNCLIPIGPRKCIAIVRQFGRYPQAAGKLKKTTALVWSKLTAAITKKILHEDLGIFDAIQRGLDSSPHAGVLGRCEERIYHFQQFMAARQDYSPTLEKRNA